MAELKQSRSVRGQRSSLPLALSSSFRASALRAWAALDGTSMSLSHHLVHLDLVGRVLPKM
jgi:hypothetical protein